MGPWSADLPDVSPPEKQLACQHARLFKYTLRHASFVHAAMQSLMQKLWFEVMVREMRGWRIYKKKSILDVMSI